MQSINPAEKLNLFDTHWDPGVIANDNDVMVVKFKDEFPYHKHDDTDDFFPIIEGKMEMDRDGDDPIGIKAGELIIVPRAGFTDRVRKTKSKSC